MLHYHSVKWNFPPTEWFKCNIDGASRGNPGEIFYGFCIKDSEGDLIYAEDKPKGVATNMGTETMAMLKVLRIGKSRKSSNILIEIDSLSLRNMIMREWKITW